MWGAVIGDIVGSRHEFRSPPTRTKDFEFLHRRCHVTDDSVCTAAVADILMRDRAAAATLQQWCRRHPDGSYGYGGMFQRWIWSDPPQPYGSYGNGAAMRVSPAAFLHPDDLEAALAAADRVTAVTHDHAEGMRGARAAVHAVWLARRGESPGSIRRAITTRHGYDLARTVDEIRPTYRYNEICQRTVPEAITCALESTSFEDAIRNAVSLGGDADTLAAIAGPIAEAMHGIPDDIAKGAARFLDKEPHISAAMERMYASAAADRSDP